MIKIKYIAYGTIIVYMVLLLIFHQFSPPELSDLRYFIESEQKIRKVEVIDIIKEKDKETQYKLDVEFCSRTVIIPESVYMEYIGEGNNAITVTAETLAIYYGYKYFILPDYETDFSKKDGDFRCIYISSTVFPWENVDTYWTKERILKEAEELIADKHQALNERTEVPEDVKAIK